MCLKQRSISVLYILLCNLQNDYFKCFYAYQRSTCIGHFVPEWSKICGWNISVFWILFVVIFRASILSGKLLNQAHVVLELLEAARCTQSLMLFQISLLFLFPFLALPVGKRLCISVGFVDKFSAQSWTNVRVTTMHLMAWAFRGVPLKCMHV